jgi:hypothetical protein
MRTGSADKLFLYVLYFFNKEKMHTKRKAESDTFEVKSHHAKSGFQNIWDDGPETIMGPTNVRPGQR